jgi:hypothetical protein
MTVIVKLINKTLKKVAENTPSAYGKISGILLIAIACTQKQICVYFQNKIPFQWKKMWKTVGCTLQQK